MKSYIGSINLIIGTMLTIYISGYLLFIEGLIQCIESIIITGDILSFIFGIIKLILTIPTAWIIWYTFFLTTIVIWEE